MTGFFFASDTLLWRTQTRFILDAFRRFAEKWNKLINLFTIFWCMRFQYKQDFCLIKRCKHSISLALWKVKNHFSLIRRRPVLFLFLLFHIGFRSCVSSLYSLCTMIQGLTCRLEFNLSRQEYSMCVCVCMCLQSFFLSDSLFHIRKLFGVPPILSASFALSVLYLVCVLYGALLVVLSYRPRAHPVHTTFGFYFSHLFLN